MTWRRWSRRWGTLAAVFLVISAAGLAGWLYFIHWAPSQHDYRFQGVDVSEEQGEVDWPMVRAQGAQFAYVRATFGAHGRDAAFERHWSALFAAGVQRGAYLDYSLCQLAADQANNFNTVVPRVADALPAAVVVDFTPDCDARPERAVVVGEVARMLATIENHTGRPVLLKVSKRFDVQYRLSSAIPRAIWATSNFFPPDYAARPWRMWQSNDRRRIDGIDRPVHWDVVAP